MSPLRVLCLPGDGIGPEISGATLTVLRQVAPLMTRPLALDTQEIGFAALDAQGTTIPEAVVTAAKAADGVILGPVSHNAYPPASEGGRNPSGVLRVALDLYANIRPARCYDGLEAPTRRPFDLVVARENLEGFYADRNMHEGGGEFAPVPGVALAMRKITEAGSRRIAEAAFALAAQRRGRVTAIHKANVMRLTDGLFLQVCREIASAHPDIVYDELLVDAAAAHLVRHPDQFDVLLCTNMFGDILSDLASELSGGLGLAGSLNLGETHALAQAQHGSAPSIAGQDRANPTSLILSAAMLLRHRGEPRAAEAIETAITRALASPESRTADLGGPLGAAAFTDLLCTFIDEAHS
ncbi:isocitrate/isopropylmalate dehydrogenase family protein [Pacificoceanicola onchidii]|uniref:isocitrate/isopropylmalate dehydrogenase family protein n=1 Tax=Pacificoceanicola onchidii TaxID=2562685 RepID=UPI00197EE7E6|nr:isocitrate/isopropylmalate dehydrogenase family protein [Pacificoceanicola onchidii]